MRVELSSSSGVNMSFDVIVAAAESARAEAQASAGLASESLTFDSTDINLTACINIVAISTQPTWQHPRLEMSTVCSDYINKHARD